MHGAGKNGHLRFLNANSDYAISRASIYVILRDVTDR